MGYHKHENDGEKVAFMKNARGAVFISFSDCSFVRSDIIVLDRSDLSVHAVLHESCYFLGHVSEDMAEAMSGKEEVLLAAVRKGGGVVDLVVPVSVRAGH